MDSKSVKYKSGETIFNEGGSPDCLFIIKAGQVGVFKKSKDGTKVPLTVVGPNQFLGELAMIMGREHSAMAIALNEVTALKITKKEFEAQLEEAPPWVMALLKSAVSRLHATNDILRRNNWVDETIQGQVDAIIANHEEIKRRLMKYSATG